MAKPPPSPYPLVYVDATSGFRLRVDDLGYLGLELRIEDHAGMTLFYAPSVLSRVADLNAGRILRQFVADALVDKRVEGRWVLLPKP